jgi:hypothetical protein
MAITDLADASYFFALGAKVQARKPGRPGPFDSVDPRAQRGRRCPDSGAPMRQIDPLIRPLSTEYALPTKKVRFLVGDMSVPSEDEFFETKMAENTVHHAPTHLGPASS